MPKLPSSLVDFVETVFLLDGEKIRLDPPQVDAINAVEFGYDITNPYFRAHPPSSIPRGIIMKWPRQFGKTYAVCCAAAALLVLVPNTIIGTSSINEQGAKDIKRRVHDILHSNPETKELIERESMLEIHMAHNHSRLECNPQTEGIRGRSYDYLLIDEAASYEESILAGAIMWTATRKGKRWIMLSTPKGSGNYFGRKFHQGRLSRPIICTACHTHHDQSEFRVNFPLQKMPELPPCGVCGANSYTYGIGLFNVVPVDPWNCSFRTRDEIQALLDAEGNTPLARQEILGEFIDDIAGVFRNEWLEQCTNLTLTNTISPKSNTYYVMGADFGKYHDASSFCITHKEGGVIVFDHMFTMETGIQKLEYDDIKDKMFNLISAAHVTALVPDATGIGDPIVDDIEKTISAKKLGCRVLGNKRHRKGFVFSQVSKMELITNLEKLFSSGGIQIPPKSDGEMKKMWHELVSFSYKITEKSIKYGTQSEHDDRVIALALSCWGHERGRWLKVKSVLSGRRGQFDRTKSLQDRQPPRRFASHWTTG